MYINRTSLSDPRFQLCGMPDFGPYASISALFWRSGGVFGYGSKVRFGVGDSVGKEACEVEGVAAGEADEGLFF